MDILYYYLIIFMHNFHASLYETLTFHANQWYEIGIYFALIFHAQNLHINQTVMCMKPT